MISPPFDSEYIMQKILCMINWHEIFHLEKKEEKREELA